jgi:hypothetical protein
MNYSKGVYNMGYLLPNTWHLRKVITISMVKWGLNGYRSDFQCQTLELYSM